MASLNRSISLKAAINTSILLVSILTLLLSASITTFVYNKNLKVESAYFTETVAKIIAYNSIVPLTFDQRSGLTEFLTTLGNVKDVDNIHIYKLSDDGNTYSFFTSYNRDGILPIPTQIKKLPKLQKPYFGDDYLEYAQPIYDPKFKEELGQVYVRVKLTIYNKNLVELIQVNAIIAVFVAVIGFLVAQALRQQILRPINRFVEELEITSQSKNFEKKVSKIGFIELSVIPDAVNDLLTKITQQIRRFSLAEKEIKELNQSLEDKVIFRTKALRESNQELLSALEQVHEYQSQIVQSEKMASLGQMVAGVAHEVNTPIGLGVTASTMMSDRIEDIIEKLDEKTLSAKQLNSFLNESKENTQLIYRNLTRAANLISSFKQVAVDQSAGVVREIDLGEYIDEVITSMHPTLKKYRHTLVKHCRPNFMIKTKPGPLNQIIINLIMNSLNHAFRNTEVGEMTINVEQRHNTCIIDFKDNGCGIEEKIKQKVFDPFVTTTRGEGGSGLGLHLVYNLVTQALQGKISVVSEVNKGATFHIEIPMTIEGSSDE